MLSSERPRRAGSMAVTGLVVGPWCLLVTTPATRSRRGTAPPRRGISGAGRLVCRDELVFAVADEIGTPHVA